MTWRVLHSFQKYIFQSYQDGEKVTLKLSLGSDSKRIQRDSNPQTGPKSGALSCMEHTVNALFVWKRFMRKQLTISNLTERNN